MVYEHFLEAVRQEVSLRLAPDCRVSPIQVTKNNGLKLDGLTFTEGESRFSPAIYLDSFFREFRSGKSVEQIADALLQLYQENRSFPLERLACLSDFSSAQENVAFRLVSTEQNKERLKTLPHQSFLDLSLIYYLLIEDSEERQLTSLITKEHLTLWKTTEESLCSLALQNTPRLLPARTDSLKKMLERISGAPLPSMDSPSDLFVLSNTRGLHGASCILYPDILKDFANRTGNDVVIIPSSIHEVLLFPYDSSVRFEEFNRMVSAINQSEVPLEDRLADHIYLYSRESDQITIPS